MIDHHLRSSSVRYLDNLDLFRERVANLPTEKSINASKVLFYLTKNFFKRFRNNAELDRELVMQ